ncbi:endonuclease/exonuclease/phosphatase family protein [Kocuria oceani]|uniref:endonuclease/exonuclease/phosphatase family protein n=1 Tax=Kocuria oceani TaxID=988827 RepID=UPI0040355914
MAATGRPGPADPRGPRGRGVLTVMTFNVRRPLPRYRRGAPDAWFTRAPAVQALLRAHRPHLAALQEVHPEQLHPLRDALGPGHVLLGTGRDAGGRGERCLLAVDTTRFTVDRWRQRWLSRTPEVPGSRGAGDAFPRTAVLADLTDRRTGVAWRAVATHLDPWPERARLRQLAALQGLLLGWEGPLLLLGDWNAAAGRSRTWDAAVAGGLRDTLPPDAPGTFHRYRPPGARTPRLDWILHGGPVRVLGSRVLAERPGGVWASDHFPVLAELEHDGGTGG